MCENCGCATHAHFQVHTGVNQPPDPSHGHHSHGPERDHDHEPHAHGHDPHSHGHDPHDHGLGDTWHAHTAEDGSVNWHSHGGHGALPILEANQREAERNRGYLRARGILALNLVSSPGAGKTTLLRATLERLQPRIGCAVVVGDLETQADAMALRPTGAPVVQITTGTVCHLDARMVSAAMDTLPREGVRLLFIENVGNLVCPASFDLGEAHRIVLLATTEGENKPLKYPPIFHGARAVVITKTDLAEPAGFDRDLTLHALAQVAPGAEIIELSARTGEGLDTWIALLERLTAAEVPVSTT